MQLLVGQRVQGHHQNTGSELRSNPDCSTEDGKTLAEIASDEMVMGAVWALCEFSLLVSQQNHSDLFLTALDIALKQFKRRRVPFKIRLCKSLRTPK